MKCIVAKKFEEVDGYPRPVLDFWRSDMCDNDADFVRELEVVHNCIYGCYVIREDKIKKKLVDGRRWLNQIFDIGGIWYGEWEFSGRGGNVCWLRINTSLLTSLRAFGPNLVYVFVSIVLVVGFDVIL